MQPCSSLAFCTFSLQLFYFFTFTFDLLDDSVTFTFHMLHDLGDSHGSRLLSKSVDCKWQSIDSQSSRLPFFAVGCRLICENPMQQTNHHHRCRQCAFCLKKAPSGRYQRSWTLYSHILDIWSTMQGVVLIKIFCTAFDSKNFAAAVILRTHFTVS